MKLSEYLKKYGLSQQNFADKIQVSRPLITRIVNKTSNPSAHLMKIIEEATNGEVSMQELFNPEAPSRLKTQPKSLGVSQ
uniref:Helix-turn-helix n=1 Tax=Candidatus Kentrum sp. SD TaxID=2126332 RepID=A0A451BR46_9GAMM|nr:MAG: Helix-turn-helix [Candidatus Kentron sp. SD]